MKYIKCRLVRDKLSGNADEVYECLSVIFNNKHSRYALLNIVMLTHTITKDEYLKLDKINEICYYHKYI